MMIVSLGTNASAACVNNEATQRVLCDQVVPAMEKVGLYFNQHGHYLDYLSMSGYSVEKQQGRLFDAEKVQKLLPVISERFTNPTINDTIDGDLVRRALNFGPSGIGFSFRDMVGAMLIRGYSVEYNTFERQWSFKAHLIQQ